ncbi:MAG: hypothetical protein RLZZ387_428 [Chloroflexota bacterium]|jgi:Gpi18-like mannosyltransferase
MRPDAHPDRVQEPASPLRLALLLAIIYGALVLLLPVSGYPRDQFYFERWARLIAAYGIGDAYRITQLDYNPIFLYVLNVYGWLFRSPAELEANINLLKVVALLFDVAGVFLAMLILHEQRANPYDALLILFNVSYLYNTLIWAQIDAMHTTLVLAAILLALKHRPALAVVAYVLALNVKLQAILFLPIVLLLLLTPIIRQRALLRATLAALGVQALVALPFIAVGDLAGFLNLNLNASSKPPFASISAYNIWYLLLEQRPIYVPSATLFAGLSLRGWGYLMFFTYAAVVLLPMVVRVARTGLANVPYSSRDYQIFFLAITLAAVAFFFFNTHMRQRYVHPCIILGGIYALLARRYGVFVLLSLAYALNQEGTFDFLRLERLNLWLFDPHFVAVLYLAALGLGVVQLYLIARPSDIAADIAAVLAHVRHAVITVRVSALPGLLGWLAALGRALRRPRDVAGVVVLAAVPALLGAITFAAGAALAWPRVSSEADSPAMRRYILGFNTDYEQNATEEFYWSEQGAALSLRDTEGAPAVLQLRMTSPRPADAPPADLTLSHGAWVAGPFRVTGDWRRYHLLVPPSDTARVIALDVPTFRPPLDTRRLGFALSDLSLRPAAPEPWFLSSRHLLGGGRLVALLLLLPLVALLARARCQPILPPFLAALALVGLAGAFPYQAARLIPSGWGPPVVLAALVLAVALSTLVGQYRSPRSWLVGPLRLAGWPRIRRRGVAYTATTQ